MKSVNSVSERIMNQTLYGREMNEAPVAEECYPACGMLTGHWLSCLSRVKYHHFKGHFCYLLLFMTYYVFLEAERIPIDGKCTYDHTNQVLK